MGCGSGSSRCCRCGGGAIAITNFLPRSGLVQYDFCDSAALSCDFRFEQSQLGQASSKSGHVAMPPKAELIHGISGTATEVIQAPEPGASNHALRTQRLEWTQSTLHGVVFAILCPGPRGSPPKPRPRAFAHL